MLTHVRRSLRTSAGVLNNRLSLIKIYMYLKYFFNALTYNKQHFLISNLHERE
jgi:hypothetical protein